VRELVRAMMNAEAGGLTREHAEAMLTHLAPLTASRPQAAALLTLLAARKPSAAFVAGLAEGLLARAVRPKVADTELAGRAVDIVGTGGDAAGTVNISTCAAMVTAACGVPVIKHGNRAVSSQAGSADVLAAMGMPVPSSESDQVTFLERSGMCFLFAPAYHQATAELGALRRELAQIGVVTVFNVLGPLTNPGRPPFGVFGAYSAEVAELMAEALRQRDPQTMRRCCVVHGSGGLDEATPLGPFAVHDVRDGRVQTRTVDPADFGMRRCELADLKGGDAKTNARLLRAMMAESAMHGQPGGPTEAMLDAVVLNAALALEVAGACNTLGEAVECARVAIRGGATARTMAAMEEQWMLARAAAARVAAGDGGGACHG
jgi:anthranilate phosphoribosyltransferase